MGFEVVKRGAVVFTKTLPWNATDIIDFSQDINVVAGDRHQIRVRIDSPIDVR